MKLDCSRTIAIDHRPSTTLELVGRLVGRVEWPEEEGVDVDVGSIGNGDALDVGVTQGAGEGRRPRFDRPIPHLR